MEFCRAKVEDYNWNYLDQHVCGYPDFEMLGEVGPARGGLGGRWNARGGLGGRQKARPSSFLTFK